MLFLKRLNIKKYRPFWPILENQFMATKIAGETYRGEAVTLPLSQDGQVSV